MLISNELKHTPRAFLAATGRKLDAFEQVLPAVQMASEQKYPPHLTQEGKSRQRQRGGGATRAWPQIEAPLCFLPLSQQPHPLPTMHGLPFGVRQPPPPARMHRLLRVLPQAVRDRGRPPSATRGGGRPGSWPALAVPP